MCYFEYTSTGKMYRGGIKMIKVYSVDWCPECKILKMYLDKKGIEFEEIIVPDLKADRHIVNEVSGQWTVPVITIGDKSIVGYKRTEIEEALEDLK